MTTAGKYILDDHGEPVPEHDLLAWGKWVQDSAAKRIVNCEYVGLYRVSTVFLALDHNFHNDGPPVLWECMIFVGHSYHDIARDRCSGSREQAEAMHRKGCQHVRKIKHSYFISHPRRKRRRHLARQMARRKLKL